jgi:hypothetical protein
VAKDTEARNLERKVADEMFSVMTLEGQMFCTVSQALILSCA